MYEEEQQRQNFVVFLTYPLYSAELLQPDGVLGYLRLSSTSFLSLAAPYKWYIQNGIMTHLED